MVVALARSSGGARDRRFAALTLQLQSRSKRARFDATQHYWRLAMLCALAACALWLRQAVLPSARRAQEWPLLCGVLALLAASCR
jgi:anti-sigma-K factor RskA